MTALLNEPFNAIFHSCGKSRSTALLALQVLACSERPIHTRYIGHLFIIFLLRRSRIGV
jgi:hypothetical protein